MLGSEPILTKGGNPVVATHGRHSYVTRAGSGPSVGKHILYSYLPREHAQVGTKLSVFFMGELYPVTVEVVGGAALFDPENLRMNA